MERNKVSLGLALSGSGDRSSFYVGFLEVFQEQNIKLDYISAMSGASLVAAAYACGTLEEFKQMALTLNGDTVKTYFTRAKSGGIYSLDLLEEELRKYTKGLNFEDVRPHMNFIAIDIETGKQIDMCMGDIARAARISCTLPGVFAPTQWGEKTLVDGGLLTSVPLEWIRNAGVDISIGVNMRGTKHIFSEKLISAKKVFNIFKKFLLFEHLEGLFNSLMRNEDAEELVRKPGIFSVLGRSLDLAIMANKKDLEQEEDLSCNLLIRPEIVQPKGPTISEKVQHYYYHLGRQTALEYMPSIKMLIEEKEKMAQKV